MTHEELLAKINHQADVWDEPMAKALRAVVELHKPIWDNQPMSKCMCREDTVWPCSTIQKIIENLK